MTELEKAKKLAELDKYEHELATLEHIDAAPLYGQRNVLVSRMKIVRDTIAMIKHILKYMEEGKDD